ncbi:two-component regulator propeller domain-containing protein [Alteromonas sp. a30]|uniref:two-component regulator propeller domain-containing protein n=1 Tax=Alteromonas sp. a30 TaxID=2730917 RepID=UPI002281029C|nr:two-component regulator propeller domain-containing protein [Alteromonas sp. a30]MCY7296261.1 diguanylate cyclase [Alteromonas sp. a30]
MRFDVYDIDRGLAQEVVRGVIQDQRGFLWIATEEGLDRFDGFNFEPFRHEPQNPKSLSSDVITDMAIDDSGNIWLGTFGGGINRFNPLTNQSTRIGAQSLSSDRIQSIFIDSRQHIWVGTFEHGLDRIIPDEEKIEIVNYKLQGDAASHPSITAFTEDKLGRIWVGSDGGGIRIYDASLSEWRAFEDVFSGIDIQNAHIRSLLADEKGNIWIGTASEGLYRFHLGTETLSHFKNEPFQSEGLSDNRVLSLLEDSEGVIWVGTDDGVNLIRDDDEVVQIRHSDTNPNSLSSNRVLSIFEDTNGLIWLGTFRGLNKWNPITDRFNHTLPRISKSHDHANITGFAEFKSGDFAIATYGGGVLIQEQQSSHYTIISEDNGLPDNRVMSIFVDKDDGLWIGTRAEGLVYIPSPDAEIQYFVNDPDDSTSLPSNGVTDIYQDKHGDIWVSTYNGGLSRKVGGGFVTYTANPSNDRSLSSNNVMQIHEGADGHLWLATVSGLNRFDRDTNRFYRYQHDPVIKESLSSNMVWHLFEDTRGNYWIATEGNGVNLWLKEDRRKGIPRFLHIGRQEGLPSNTVYGFAEDNEGRIWMSSNKGLVRYHPQDGSVEYFDKSHGLQGYDFNQGAVLKRSNGEIYFGGSNGFNHFSADFDPIDSNPPNVELLSVSGINNSEFDGDTHSKITLAYNDYLVAFDFVALDFAAPEKNQYQYKLEHFDSDWVSVGNLRRATYTNLPAGSYTFMVKASNHNGKWSEPQINLPVKVEPAPWLTIYAFGAYAAIISIIIMSLIQHQLKKFAQEEAQRKRLERVVAERTKELEDQNNKLTALNNELEAAYRVDALTGLNNRHFLNAYLGQRLSIIDQAHMTLGKEAQHMLIMLLDMDNLKPINDTFGHAAGDAAICHLARMIQERIPKEFHLIRWGGDEFMLVGEVKDKQETCAWIENLYGSLKAGSFFYFKQKIQLTCSAGFGFYPFDHENPRALSWDQVSMVADKALYSAKMEKGNWCGVIGPTREINELYLNELLRCKHIKEVEGLVKILDTSKA